MTNDEKTLWCAIVAAYRVACTVSMSHGDFMRQAIQEADNVILSLRRVRDSQGFVHDNSGLRRDLSSIEVES